MYKIKTKDGRKNKWDHQHKGLIYVKYYELRYTGKCYDSRWWWSNKYKYFNAGNHYKNKTKLHSFEPDMWIKLSSKILIPK